MTQSESAIQRAILDCLRCMGCTVWRNQSGSVRVRGAYMQLGPEGSPDIVGYTLDGRFLGIEVKQVKGRLSDAQERWRASAAKAGCIVGVARSVEDAVEIIHGARGRVA